MRRVLTIVLILVFAGGPLMMALPGSEDARLPACCRRLGAHHCAMVMAMMRTAATTPSFAAPSHCPDFPVTAPAVLNLEHALIAPRAAVLELRPSTTRHAFPAIARTSRHGNAYAGRAPPASSLA